MELDLIQQQYNQALEREKQLQLVQLQNDLLDAKKDHALLTEKCNYLQRELTAARDALAQSGKMYDDLAQQAKTIEIERDALAETMDRAFERILDKINSGCSV